MGDLSLPTLHLLSLLDAYGPMDARELTERANTECVSAEFDAVPEIATASGRLLSMRKAGLVASSRPYDDSPLQWSITDEGRAAWRSWGPPPSLSLSQIELAQRCVNHMALGFAPSAELRELSRALALMERAMRAELTEDEQ